MRNSLILLAPCAVFASVLASAKAVEKPTTGGGDTGTQIQVIGAGINSPSGVSGASNSGVLGLQGTLNSGVVSPVPTPDIPTPAAVHAISLVPGAALPIKAPAKTPVSETTDASAVLDKAVYGITQGKQAEAAGGDGLSVRQALDRAYDASTRTGGAGGTGVAGKFASSRETVAGFVDVANNSAPADAPGLYGSAIKAAGEALPPGTAAAVTKAVLSFAARKADLSLSELVQAAYTAAAAGQADEARRLVKALDKWEELLSTPARPALIVNGDRLKDDVERVLAVSDTGAKGSAPRVWVVRRGKSYVAVLPGTVEKVPGLAATFALALETMPAASIAGAYRAFVAAPGVVSTSRARLAMGEAVPSAALGTGWLWLKYMVMRAWSALASWLPGRGLPAVADAATLPRLREAAKSWRDASGLGAAAARAAGAASLTVSRARGAFALARRAAAAHETLIGEAGAVSRIDALAAEFEAGVARAALSPADRLTPGLEMTVAGEGGLGHWASLYASDARERGGKAFRKVRGESSVVVLSDGPGAFVAARLAAAAKGMSFTAFGDALEASGAGPFGAVELSADLRSTENGGALVLKIERNDEQLAAALDQLGFFVTSDGRGLRATLDAQTLSADAREMAETAADAAALLTGAPVKSRMIVPAGLDRLLADMRRTPKAAAKAAASLDGTPRLSRARTVGWVGDDEAVAIEIPSQGVRVIALRDPATGLPKFARIEPLRVQ